MPSKAAVGQDVAVTLRDRGSRPRAFTIDLLHIDADVPPRPTRTVTIPAPPLGELRSVSRAGCDEATGMTGTMVIFI